MQFAIFELEEIQKIHDQHGPRVAYAWFTGQKDIFDTVSLDTSKVEDFSIAFYTEYNKEIGFRY